MGTNFVALNSGCVQILGGVERRYQVQYII